MKLNKKSFLVSFLLLAAFLAITSKVSAAVTNPVIGQLGTNEGAADGSKFINYTVYLWKVSMNLGALAVIVYFIWGAFEWIMSGSDSKKAESARGRMTNAIVGLVLLVASFTILSFISKIFFGKNFDLLKLTLPTQSSGLNGPSTNSNSLTSPSGTVPSGAAPSGGAAAGINN